MEHCASAARQTGVSLVELLIVMVIVAILMAVGVPSYRYVTTDNRMSTEANALLGDLRYARSEAIREGQAVTVCIAQNTTPTAPSCAGTGVTSWQNGWVIFSDLGNNQTLSASDPVLRIHSAFSSGDTFSASNNLATVTFNRSGFANKLGTAQALITLHDSTSTSAYTRCVAITSAGMLMVQTPSQNSSCQ